MRELFDSEMPSEVDGMQVDFVLQSDLSLNPKANPISSTSEDPLFPLKKGKVT